MTFTQTPYAGPSRPFSIGLKSIPHSCWILPDDLLAQELSLKRELLAQSRDVVARVRADTQAAQDELLGLLVEHLVSAHGGTHRRAGGGITIAGAGTVDLTDPADPPIVRAARLVQDDLVLMRKDHDGWRLVAACLCFPSNWSLAEKFDLPMDAIHASVPGFAGQMAGRVNRIFDHLPQEHIVERFNWSIHDDDGLHHPRPKPGPRPWHDPTRAVADCAFVRVERQTLRRLPVSQDIVFTIRTYIDPVSAFRDHPDGWALALALRDQLGGLDRDQLAYKNMLAERDLLIGALSALAR